MPAVNLPNSITLTRIFSIPLLIWLLSTNHFHAFDGEQELLASALFIAASITDGIDGYLARRRGQITTMGILLDPLADKLLIAAAFITLVQFNPSLVPAWVAVVIIAREFLVSGLRSIAASEGFTIEAAIERNPLTRNSRAMMTTATHAGTRPGLNCTNAMKAAAMRSLSARGSSNIPMVVICPRRRARYPSIPSVIEAAINNAEASNSCSPSKARK